MDARRSLTFTALVFAFLAALSRLWFDETYSRYQVLAFIGLAAMFELLRASPGRPLCRLSSFAGNAAAAFGAIVFVKWQLEGISLSHWANLLAAAV